MLRDTGEAKSILCHTVLKSIDDKPELNTMEDYRRSLFGELGVSRFDVVAMGMDTSAGV